MQGMNYRGENWLSFCKRLGVFPRVSDGKTYEALWGELNRLADTVDYLEGLIAVMDSGVDDEVVDDEVVDGVHIQADQVAIELCDSRDMETVPEEAPQAVADEHDEAVKTLHVDHSLSEEEREYRAELMKLYEEQTGKRAHWNTGIPKLEELLGMAGA